MIRFVGFARDRGPECREVFDELGLVRHIESWPMHLARSSMARDRLADNSSADFQSERLTRPSSSGHAMLKLPPPPQGLRSRDPETE